MLYRQADELCPKLLPGEQCIQQNNNIEMLNVAALNILYNCTTHEIVTWASVELNAIYCVVEMLCYSTLFSIKCHPETPQTDSVFARADSSCNMHHLCVPDRRWEFNPGFSLFV